MLFCCIRWLRKEFNDIRGRQETVSWADVKKWLTKSYFRITSPKLKEYYKVRASVHSGTSNSGASSNIPPT